MRKYLLTPRIKNQKFHFKTLCFHTKVRQAFMTMKLRDFENVYIIIEFCNSQISIQVLVMFISGQNCFETY